MNKLTPIIASVFTVLMLLTGCSNYESEKQAITRSLSYDRALVKQATDRASIWEIFLGSNDQNKADYVRNLKRVPLRGCPKDFKHAYESHVAAWENRNESSIKSTWADVLAIASLHGVDWK